MWPRPRLTAQSPLPPLQSRSPPPLSQLSPPEEPSQLSPPEEPSQLSLPLESPVHVSPSLVSPEHESEEESLLPSQLSSVLVPTVSTVPEQPQLTSIGVASTEPDPLE